MDRHHVQAVVEILAERAFVDLLLEVLVGRGDDPDVYLDVSWLPTANLALLECAKNLGLHVDIQLPISSSKKGALSAASNRP
jgi:hypothetical protein